MADTAEIPGGPGPPLISRPNGGPKGPPKIFEVRFALTPPPPPPPIYLRIWMTGYTSLSEGMRLPLSWLTENLFQSMRSANIAFFLRLQLVLEL